MKKSFKKLAAALAAFTMISAAAYGGTLSANAADQSATAWGDANLDKEVGLIPPPASGTGERRCVPQRRRYNSK